MEDLEGAALVAAPVAAEAALAVADTAAARIITAPVALGDPADPFSLAAGIVAPTITAAAFSAA